MFFDTQLPLLSLDQFIANLPVPVNYDASRPVSNDVAQINALYAQLFSSTGVIKSKFYKWNPNPVSLRLPAGAAPVYNALSSIGFGTKSATIAPIEPSVRVASLESSSTS